MSLFLQSLSMFLNL